MNTGAKIGIGVGVAVGVLVLLLVVWMLSRGRKKSAMDSHVDTKSQLVVLAPDTDVKHGIPYPQELEGTQMPAEMDNRVGPVEIDHHRRY
jgi:hypothetical protein